MTEYCKPFRLHTKINPSYTLAVESWCQRECENAIRFEYKNTIYMQKYQNSDFTEISNVENNKFILGSDLSEFTIMPDLFKKYANVSFYNIKFEVTAIYENEIKATGFTIMKVKINEKPFNGTCSVDRNEGYALSDTFTIECNKWIDNDGYIVRYEYFAKYSNNSTPIAINFNNMGVLKSQLPQGLESNSFKLFLFVQIIDDSDAITIFDLKNPITVKPRPDYLANVSKQLLDNPENSSFLKMLKNADLQQSSRNIISISSMLNDQNSNTTSSQDAEKIKNIFTNVANDFQANDLSSVKVVASVLSLLTTNKDQLWLESAEMALAKSLQLSNKLLNMSKSNGYLFLIQAANKIVDTAANSLLNANSHNSTNIENLEQSTKLILDQFTQLSSVHLSINQQTRIKSNSIDFHVARANSDNLQNKNIDLENGQFQLAKLDCIKSKQNVMLKSYSMPEVVGSKDPSLANSPIVSLSYLSENQEEIKIKDNTDLFKIKIRRDLTKFDMVQFSHVETLFQNSTNPLMSNRSAIYLKLKATQTINSSQHLQIKPLEQAQIFVVLFKFNEMPSFTSKLFDFVHIVCPNKLIVKENDSYYQVSTNMSTTFKYLKTNLFGIGIAGFNSSFERLLCDNNTNSLINEENIFDHLSFDQLDLENDYSYRVFSSGCYYRDKLSGEWKSDNLEVITDETDIEHTVCLSNHLTDFAAGFIVLPSEIDFGNAFANSSFDKNRTIYITVIVCSCIYLFAAIFCIYQDKKDKLKNKIYLMKDSSQNLNYYYEIVFFTGSRLDSGTKSNVYLSLFGTNDELINMSVKSQCQADNKNLFKRSSVDTFIMGAKRPLGRLYMCQVGHDNSAKTKQHASWFLKHILISDLQTGEKFTFICEKW